MNRKQRLALRRTPAEGHLNRQTEVLNTAMRNAGIGSSDREAFLNWAVTSLWDAFKTERMQQRIMIENEISQLGLRLPNGTVKKKYSATFHVPADKISDIRLDGAKELGLDFKVSDAGECSLSGVPNEAGDFTLRLRYSTIEGEPASELAIPIAFNPDPRDLWRDIQTNPNIIYYKPDSDTVCIKPGPDTGGSKRKTMVAASRRGRSHAQEGKPRDDDFRLYHCEESDWYILAVADGAGSARYSRWGSKVACEAAVDYCRSQLVSNPDFEASIREYVADREDTDKRTRLTRNVIHIIFNGARKAFEEVKKTSAANEDSKLKDFATTLMFAICKKYDFGWFIASFWVGDGAMAVYDAENKSLKLLGTPDEGEFSGQTRFLTMPEIFHDPDLVSKRVRMAVVPDFTSLFLMTDGVSDPMFETERNLNDFARWEDFHKKLSEGFPEDNIEGVNLSDHEDGTEQRLLKWLDFWSPGNHDDRTIAILY